MKRRLALLLSVAGVVLAGALSSQSQPRLLLLDWAGKAKPIGAPVAVLIEMGLKDKEPAKWSGHVTVEGGKIVGSEGYRFEAGDKVVSPDGWEASSHYAVTNPAILRRIPQLTGNKAAVRPGGVVSVGVVLKLQNASPNTVLTVSAQGREKATVPMHDVLTGKTVSLWDGNVRVRRLSTAQPLAAITTEDDFPAATWAPDGTLWVAYISYTLKEERRRGGFVQIDEQPADFKAYHQPGFDDQLFVKSYRDGRWSEPLAVTGPHEDLVRCTLAAQGDGTVWVIYSAHRQDKHDIYARAIAGPAHGRKLGAGAEQRLTRESGRSLSPVACTDQQGDVHVAYQHWSAGETPERGAVSRIGLLQCHEGKWTAHGFLPGPNSASNQWYPSIAAGPDGKVAVAYDVYDGGDYDVRVAIVQGGQISEQVVAASPLFEARPSVAFDPKGRLWIAYEEGPEKWGKNYGALDADRGNPLYQIRSVRVVCLADGKLFRTTAELPTSQRATDQQMDFQTPRYAYARLGVDTAGRLWLTYRSKLPTPFGVMPGTNWLTYACRLDGKQWTEPIEISHSDGLLDSRPAVLPNPGGGVLLVTNTDGRYTTPHRLHNQIYAGVLDLPGEPQEPSLTEKPADKQKDNAEERVERAAIERMRNYRLEARGTKYRLRRGDFHRHTEISFDGGPDGSLEDFFRYSIDVAALDWVGCTDHDYGLGREYTWWLTQKFSDAYHVPGCFTPMFSYERSVAYPMGHRNVVFARRGILPLPRLGAPLDRQVGGVHADDTKMLYRYLKELGGLCSSHTSATSMGTDWRDNDSELEPMVEIYQGDRMSYEKEGAPRAGYEAKSGLKPINIAGWYPKGYLNLAFAKGYRFAFQSSSDHISTHISYCDVLTEDGSREAIMKGFRQRLCYAATEDILVELRSGNHQMGEEFATEEAPSLQFRVVGAKPLEQIDILKDSEVVATLKPGKQEHKETWADPQPTKGTHYYYIRVQQSDGELAWASPIWIDYRGR
jgi:hypothetical protein